MITVAMILVRVSEVIIVNIAQNSEVFGIISELLAKCNTTISAGITVSRKSRSCAMQFLYFDNYALCTVF